jgi:hypothetical protein
VGERALEGVYEETRRRIVALVKDRDAGSAAEAAATAVPACPSWSVRDVLAHVTALYSDIVAGNLQGAGSDAWTAEQVVPRRSMTLDELFAESDEVGPKLAAMLDDFPGWYGKQVVGDAAVHEQDIRGALARPGARDSSAIAIGLELQIRAIVHPGATALGIGPVEVRADHRSWVVGTGEPPAGSPDDAIAAAIAAAPEDEPTPRPEPIAHLKADSFELFRAISGRRSAAQIRRFDWATDPEPYLPLFDLWPFTLRSTDLAE